MQAYVYVISMLYTMKGTVPSEIYVSTLQIYWVLYFTPAVCKKRRLPFFFFCELRSYLMMLEVKS
jgi:hypothetical protein